MEKQKRGPKSQTLVMVPLSELISKLPANSKVKLSRVWYSGILESLGQDESEPCPFPEAPNQVEEKIHVESLDLTDETE